MPYSLPTLNELQRQLQLAAFNAQATGYYDRPQALGQLVDTYNNPQFVQTLPGLNAISGFLGNEAQLTGQVAPEYQALIEGLAGNQPHQGQLTPSGLLARTAPGMRFSELTGNMQNLPGGVGGFVQGGAGDLSGMGGMQTLDATRAQAGLMRAIAELSGQAPTTLPGNLEEFLGATGQPTVQRVGLTGDITGDIAGVTGQFGVSDPISDLIRRFRANDPTMSPALKSEVQRFLQLMMQNVGFFEA